MTKRDKQASEYANEERRVGEPCPHVRGTVTQHCSLNFTLTDEEREAIKTAVGGMCLWMKENEVTEDESLRRRCATLRNLLERLK